MSMLSVWYLQFYQSMMLSSIVVSFIPVAIVALQSQTDRRSNPSIFRNLFIAILRTVTVFALTLVVNIILKVFFYFNDFY